MLLLLLDSVYIMEENVSPLAATEPQPRTGGRRVVLKVNHPIEFDPEEAHGKVFVSCFFEKQVAYLGFGSPEEGKIGRNRKGQGK